MQLRAAALSFATTIAWSATALASDGLPAAEDPSGVVIKTVLGLMGLFVLALLAGHRYVRRVEAMLGLSSVIASGFPFVALGVIARHPAVGVLTDDVLAELTPVVQFGLGWLGLGLGFRLDLRILDRLPQGTITVLLIETSLPFATILLGTGATLLALGQPWQDAIFVRDAMLLGAAGAMTAPAAVRFVARHTSDPITTASLAVAGQLEEIAGIIGLAFLAAYFRPASNSVTWVVPGTAWLFITLGLGLTLGALIYGVLRRPASSDEATAITLGSVAFTAGMAGYLGLPPVVIGFLVGAIVGNLPGRNVRRIRMTAFRLERPIYLLFLVVAGALWKLSDWRGWVLLPAFTVCRLIGNWLGLRLARSRRLKAFGGVDARALTVAPLSTLAIALVVSVQQLYRDESVAWIVTAVIAGAVLSEFLSQLLVRVGNGEPEVEAEEP